MGQAALRMLDIKIWPNAPKISSASYRIRCLLVCKELSRENIPISIYKKNDKPPKVLLLSKRYDEKTIKHAMFLREKYGTKIIIDICDNHFIHDNHNRRALFKRAICMSDIVIASTEYLAEIIKKECDKKISIYTIDDYIEKPYYPNIFESILSIKDLLFYYILKYKLFIFKKSKKMIWFGAHQGGYGESGMQDLLKIKEIMEEMKEEKITLTVISNSYEKYLKIVKEWKIRTFYLPWSVITFSKALNLHDIALIPINKNQFTMSKTANRVTTSLIHDLQVIADEIPSYKKYDKYIYLNNWKISFNLILKGIFKTEKLNVEKHNQEITNKWLDVVRK